MAFFCGVFPRLKCGILRQTTGPVVGFKIALYLFYYYCFAPIWPLALGQARQAALQLGQRAFISRGQFVGLGHKVWRRLGAAGGRACVWGRALLQARQRVHRGHLSAHERGQLPLRLAAGACGRGRRHFGAGRLLPLVGQLHGGLFAA